MRRLLFALALGLVIPTASFADDDSEEVEIPTASKFLVHVDIKAFRKTEFGGKLFEMARQAAMEEIADDDQAEAENKFQKIKEALGFDPFKELDGITLTGSNFDSPEEGLNVVFKLRKTSGNLEGLFIALPEYESTEYGRHEIHSAKPDDNEQVFGAIHTDAGGTKRIVAARTIDEVKSLLDSLDGTGGKKSKRVKLARKNREFFHVEMLEVPHDKIGRKHAHMAKMVQRVSFKVADPDGELLMNLQVTANEEKHAKQIKQLVQGGIALAQLVQDDEDEDLQTLQAFLQRMSIEQEGLDVRIKMSVPEQQLIDLIEQEMELSLFNMAF